MHFTPLITAASLAASTKALLLPTVIENESDDVFQMLPIELEDGIPTAMDIRSYDLSCPGCPLRVRAGRKGWKGEPKIRFATDIASHLELTIALNPSERPNRLTLNDFEIHPHADPFSGSLTADLVPDDVSIKTSGDRNVPLGYQLGVRSIFTNNQGDKLVSVDLQIFEVDGIFVEGIPDVEIIVINTAEGGYLIANVKSKPSRSILATTVENLDSCDTMICKARAIVNAQLARVRGSHCGGEDVNDETVDKTEPSEAPTAVRHEGRSWVHLLRNIASHIVLPIAIGLVAGVIASLLGMVCGIAVGYFWRKFVRGSCSRRRYHHRRGHSTHKNSAYNNALDEKACLMTYHDEEVVDAPPAYVDTPTTMENIASEIL